MVVSVLSFTGCVRQGGVLSPVLFAIFIDSVVDKVKSTGLGCYYFSVCVSIFLYADILLIAPSVDTCEKELTCLDMQINTKKIGMHSHWCTL